MSASAEASRPLLGQTEFTGSTPDETAWRAYPLAARLFRTAAVLVPVAMSVGVVFGLDKWLPASRSWEQFAAIAVLDLVTALVVVFAVNRLARRLLPLATLLSLSLVFPDRAPRRFAIALRANSTAQLRSRMAVAHTEDADVATALEDLLTYLAALSRHDPTTRGHCERVRAFVDLLATEMNLSDADQDRIRWSALLHDIGKLRVPRPILRKPGKPTDEEWASLRRHPVEGSEIIKPLAPWLGPWALAVEEHHERFDGHGYPNGLAGTDISLGGRILAVADAYEVMITSRPYKRPVRPEAARQELVACSGHQFDPDIVRAFLGIAIGDLRRTMGLLGVLSEVPILATVPRAEALIEMAGRQTVGAVGTAAGTGALAVAASLSPVQIPAATPHVPSAVSPDTTRQPVRINPLATASPVDTEQSHLTPDRPTQRNDVASTSGPVAGVPISDSGTTTNSQQQVVGTVGRDVSIPAAVSSAEVDVTSITGSVPGDVGPSPVSIGQAVGSTAGVAVEHVTPTGSETENTDSAVDAAAEGSAEGVSEQQPMPPDVVP